MLDVVSGSVVDLRNCYLPPEWRLVALEEDMQEWDLHFRTTIRELDVLPRELDWKERFIRPKKDISDRTVPVNTLYKRVADKVHPVSVPLTDGSVPEGQPGWKKVCLEKYHTRFRARYERTRFDRYLKPRIAEFARGARLTPEREEKLVVGTDLLPEERELLREMLFKREGVLAWSWEHIRRVHPEVFSPQKIRTIDHEPWQHPGFQIPRALHQTKSWFLVKKKAAGQYRIVIAAMKLNSVTIRDANMPPNADEFAEDFAGMQICSMVDLFSGYDQISLAEECRDMPAIMTPMGLFRMVTILQGGANSVAQCQRVVQFVLADIYGKAVQAFLDDFGIKGPKTTYNDEMAFPGVRRYVLEHLKNLDETLYLLELAGMVISAEKSQFVMKGVAVVGWVCDRNGRRPDEVKVAKLVDWPTPMTVFEVRSFVGLAVYFRIVVEKFGIIIAPLYQLLKAGAPFAWGAEQQLAFDKIKRILSSFPYVLPIDYDYQPLEIIVAVDASGTGWGGVLMQVRNGVRKPARYESGVWSESERMYDAGKRECRGVLKALKKFRHWLYGVHFTLEIDAKTLVAQLNRSATDLPGALVTSWIAWIRLFDFEVKHVPGQKHGAADGLSRRPHTAEEIAEQEKEEDIDEFILVEISALRVMLNPVAVSVETPPEAENADQDQDQDQDSRTARILALEYSDESEQIAKWCTSFRRPPGMPIRRYKTFKNHACDFVVQGEHLFHRGKGLNLPLRRVLDQLETRKRVIVAAHDELGHKGRESTYHLLKLRYWWEGLYSQVSEYVRTCPKCQFRDPRRLEEPLLPNRIQYIWEQVYIDTATLPNEDGYQCMIQAREALSGWIEARPLKGKATGSAVCEFIWDDIICRYGFPSKIVMDKGPEFRSEVQLFLEKKGIKRVAISPYNPGSNGAIERSMRTFKDALSKMTSGYSAENAASELESGNLSHSQRSRNSRQYADDDVCNHGHDPYRFLYGKDAVLPLEMEVPTWSTLPWETISSTEDLISLRARQILQKDADIAEALHRYERIRERNKDYFDSTRAIRLKPLEVGNLVLVHDTQIQDDVRALQKLRFRWHGPYRIREVVGNGSYKLEELDGTPMRHFFSAGEGMGHSAVNGDRLKRFWLHRDTRVRQQSFPPRDADLEDLEDEDG
ncbi:hypothetical protein N7486_003164 [Penicillium sp. IBT 16267x]|nr:hypothetical protein N7486_003164 [Penicillium sp. IBT 16267x]